MRPRNKQEKGARGEKIALWYLSKKGYLFVEKHYTCRSGELDLVMRDNQQTVFVEVKYRIGTSCGLPEEAVNRKKLYRLNNAILSYISKKGIDDFRIDVVAIVENFSQGKVLVRHHKAVEDYLVQY